VTCGSLLLQPSSLVHWLGSSTSVQHVRKVKDKNLNLEPVCTLHSTSCIKPACGKDATEMILSNGQ
jgi:hypothetical protein